MPSSIGPSTAVSVARRVPLSALLALSVLAGAAPSVAAPSPADAPRPVASVAPLPASGWDGGGDCDLTGPCGGTVGSDPSGGPSGGPSGDPSGRGRTQASTTFTTPRGEHRDARTTEPDTDGALDWVSRLFGGGQRGTGSSATAPSTGGHGGSVATGHAGPVATDHVSGLFDGLIGIVASVLRWVGGGQQPSTGTPSRPDPAATSLRPVLTALVDVLHQLLTWLGGSPAPVRPNPPTVHPDTPVVPKGDTRDTHPHTGSGPSLGDGRGAAERDASARERARQLALKRKQEEEQQRLLAAKKAQQEQADRDKRDSQLALQRLIERDKEQQPPITHPCTQNGPPPTLCPDAPRPGPNR